MCNLLLQFLKFSRQGYKRIQIQDGFWPTYSYQFGNTVLQYKDMFLQFDVDNFKGKCTITIHSKQKYIKTLKSPNFKSNPSEISKFQFTLNRCKNTRNKYFISYDVLCFQHAFMSYLKRTVRFNTEIKAQLREVIALQPL